MEKIVNVMETINLKTAIDEINKEISIDHKVIEANDGILKWRYLPSILTLDVSFQDKFLEFIRFVDGLMISKTEKYIYIITLAGLIGVKRFNILSLEDGYIFTIVDYFKNKNMDTIKEEFDIINNQELINAVRNKSLQIEVRNKILDFVYRKLKENGISNDSKQVNSFIKEMIDTINQIEYYELLELTEK